MPPLVLSVLRGFAVYVPLALLGSHLLGYAGIFWATAATNVLLGVAGWYWCRLMIRRKSAGAGVDPA